MYRYTEICSCMFIQSYDFAHLQTQTLTFYILETLEFEMTEIDDFFRTREDTDKQVRALNERREIELWSKIIAETTPEKLRLLSADKNPHMVRWVDTGADVVVVWQLTYAGEDYVIVIFQDGRLGTIDATRGYSHGSPAHVFRMFGGEYLTDGMGHDYLSKVMHAFFTTGPFMEHHEQLRGVLDGNWRKPDVFDAMLLQYDVA